MTPLDELIARSRNNLNSLLRLKLEQPNFNEPATLRAIIENAEYLYSLIRARDSASHQQLSQ